MRKAYKIYYALNGRHRLGMHITIYANNEQNAIRKFKRKFDSCFEPVFVSNGGTNLNYECRLHNIIKNKPIMQVYGKDEEEESA